MFRSWLVIIWSLLLQHSLPAQSKWVFENYTYPGQQGAGAIVPMVHVETKNNWYAELRYNYEDVQTLSFFGGKTFTSGNAFEYSLTPLAGFSTGNFTGISLGMNTGAAWKNFYLSSQTQYSIGTKREVADFFFSWSEVGYNLSPVFFSGLAMQYTRQSGHTKFEPGFVAGVCIKDFSFPVYVFSPFHGDRYFVVGLNYEYNWKKKKS